jgi:hypothetical protein
MMEQAPAGTAVQVAGRIAGRHLALAPGDGRLAACLLGLHPASGCS